PFGKPKKPAEGKSGKPDEPFEELPDLSEYEIALTGDPLAEGPLSDTVPTQGPSPAVQPPDEAISFDVPPPTGDPASFTIGVSLEDLGNLPDVAGLSGTIPTAQPASGEVKIPEATPGSSARIGRPPSPKED